MEFTEEFVLDGKNFIYIDFSRVKRKGELIEAFDAIKPIIAKYPENSLYTITNVSGVGFDSELREYLVDYVSHNKPYVKCGAVIGMDGVKKIMSQSILKIGGRTNMIFAFSKEQAVEMLMKRE